MYIENPFKEAEDKLLFAKTLDKLTIYEKNGNPSFTDFLNPIQSAAFMQVLVKYTKNAKSFGGHDGAERMMIGFGAASEADFPITPLAVTYNGRFSKAPSHRDYLGATIGLGLDRGKIGDIRTGEGGAVVYVASDIAYYIAENMEQVGRTSVKIVAGKTVEGLEQSGQEKRVTVASLRLDAVLSAALNLSRGKVVQLIDSDKVFVNWKPAKKTQTLAEGDNVTVRGMGRIVIDTQGGKTKKDRIVLLVTKFVS